ncbi:hypothetical protein [Alicyclobacillus fastidiosus]|uniref:Uncharacterized protein n=1 Tax=Alicyclobacillus fastidiosus TaxID=392011 RepID=A0ABV5AGT6_9BACL|nr:hypothetical protein [Alicyclobacillus fastidiosus]WEH07873.1 hypothetical protein PYS47_14005 [Alicyclobacillus fastidiosus]
MMRQTAVVARPWPLLVVAGALLLGVFTYYDGRLFNGVASASFGGLNSQHTTARQAADPVAPQSMIDALTKAVGDVPGLNDMAVVPDGNGDGRFMVSAMVDLAEVGDGTSAASGGQQGLMNQAVDAYFKGVFGQGPLVSEAMLTFTNGDAIVGTAGLGRTEYEKMATTTMSGDLAGAMSEQKAVQDNSPNDVWFQTQ